jgi:O-antigen/teichoic acid export membrane protein
VPRPRRLIVRDPRMEPQAPELIDTPDAGPIVIRGGILRTASFVAGLALSTLSAPLIVRHLGENDYGRYLPIISLVALVSLIADNAMTNVAMREYTAAEAPERLPLLRALLGLRMAMTVAGFAIVFVFAVIAGYQPRQLEGMLIAGLGLLIADYLGAFQAPMGVGLRLGWVSIIEFVRNAGTVAAVIVLVVVGAGLVPFFATAAVGALAALAVTGAVVRSSAPWVPVYDRVLWRDTLRQVLPVAAATTFGTVYFRLVLIVMSLVGTESQTGHFSVSFRIMEIALSIPALIVASAFPILVRAASHDRARLNYALTRIVEVGVILGLWVALIIWLLAPLAVDVVSGGRSHETIGALRLQGLSMPASFLVAAGGSALLSLRDNRGLLIANAGALVTALVASLLLIGPLGAEGAALAITIAEVGLATLMAVFARRGAQLHVPARLLLALPAAAAGWALGTALPEVAGAVVATALYFGVLLALRVVPREVIEALAGGARSARA